MVGGNTQAPRAAVICVNAEMFTQQGSADYFATIGRTAQARLGEISQALGISFPVYVLFTRCDRLPFFTDYVRGLTNDEAGQVLGITLPMHNVQAGVYGEEETRRLVAAFDSLFYSLADKRLHFLPRESDPQKLPGAYEFPREFRKLRNAVVQLLVDIGRPSQLRTSPFLRGFYFSGVRPVVVQDTPLPAATPMPARSAQASGHATGMFQAMRPGAAAQPAQQPQYTGSKRVPQWVFVSRLFNQVILQDRAALAASGSSTKTSGLQRMLLIGASLLLFFTAIAFTVSFFKNRAMVNNAVAVAEAIPATEAAGTRSPRSIHCSGSRHSVRHWSRCPHIESMAARSAWGGFSMRETTCIRIFARPTTIASVSCCSRKPRAPYDRICKSFRLRLHRRMTTGSPMKS